MKNYQELLKEIRDNGYTKAPARPGMPGTKELFARTLRMDLSKGFPLLTSKAINFHNIIVELLWFMKGDTNIQYLVKHKCNIGNADAYKYYLRFPRAKGEPDLTKSEFIEHIKAGRILTHNVEHLDYMLGDLGNIYGIQWRNWGFPTRKGFDQLKALVEGILTTPDSRYHIVTAWNPTDFKEDPMRAGLPACHVYFQCNLRESGRVMDMMILQRSCDMFLGVPYNIASYALLLSILCALTGKTAGELTWVGNSVHIYADHIEAVDEQLSRPVKALPTLEFTMGFGYLVNEYKAHRISLDGFFKHLKPEMFSVSGYNPQPAILAPLSVGV